MSPQKWKVYILDLIITDAIVYSEDKNYVLVSYESLGVKYSEISDVDVVKFLQRLRKKYHCFKYLEHDTHHYKIIEPNIQKLKDYKTALIEKLGLDKDDTKKLKTPIIELFLILIKMELPQQVVVVVMLM